MSVSVCMRGQFEYDGYMGGCRHICGRWDVGMGGCHTWICEYLDRGRLVDG